MCSATARDIAGNHILISMTLVAGTTSLLVGNAYQPQMPEFAADLGQGDVGVYYSMLLGANAAGALDSRASCWRRWGLMQGRPRLAFMLVIAWCLCIMGFAVSRIYLLSLLLLFVAGFVNLAFSTMSQTLVQLHAPNAIRGRVLGLYNMASNGMRAFSGVTVGMAGSLIGIHWSLGLSALALLAVTLGLIVFDRRAAVARPADKAASPAYQNRAQWQQSSPSTGVHLREFRMFSKINHVAIVSENYAQLAQFYQAVFGMTTSDKTRPGRAVTVRDGYVGLNINPRRAGRSAGLDHFGIQVEDCETAFDRMRKKYPTVKWLKRPATRPFAGISTHDPDGNMFDISQKDMTNRTSVYVENDGKTNARHINHVALRTHEPRCHG